jgi:hypothetical protein
MLLLGIAAAYAGKRGLSRQQLADLLIEVEGDFTASCPPGHRATR